MTATYKQKDLPNQKPREGKVTETTEYLDVNNILSQCCVVKKYQGTKSKKFLKIDQK